jgi:hypothetical protein
MRAVPISADSADLHPARSINSEIPRQATATEKTGACPRRFNLKVA